MKRYDLCCLLAAAIFPILVERTVANEIVFELGVESQTSFFDHDIRDVAVGPNGNLYVLGGRRTEYYLSVLDPNGNFLRRFGDGRSFWDPSSLAVNSAGQVYVHMGSGSEPVQVYDSDGVRVMQPSYDYGSGGTTYTDVAVDSRDNVYTLYRSELHVFDSLGSFQYSTGGSTTTRVAIAPNDDIYLLGRYGISVLEPGGQYRRGISIDHIVGDDPFQLREPIDIAVDESGIYLTSRQVVHKLDLEGELEFSSIGHSGASRIAIGSEHDVLIAENFYRNSHVRAIDEATLRSWDGTTLTREEHGPFNFFDSVIEHQAPEIMNSRESKAETFLVPGTPGEQVELTFTFHTSISGAFPAFGVYSPTEVAGDHTDPHVQILEVLQEGEILFEQDFGEVTSGETATYVAEAGTELGLYIVGKRARFRSYSLSDLERGRGPQPADAFYPTFSEAGRNLAGYDQMLAFVNDDTTFFAFEDIKIATGRADFGDFTDLVVSVDVALIPVVPEPSAIALCLLALGFSFGFVRSSSACAEENTP